MLDVLMLAPTSFFADYGCHVRILEEARFLQARGHRVLVCTYHNGRDPEGLCIHRTLPIPWRRGYEVGSSRHKIAFDLLLSLRAMQSMRQFRPQIIHAHLHEGALIGLALSRLWRCGLVCDYQGSLTAEMVDHGFIHRKGLIHRFFRRLETTINRASPRILTSSQKGADLLSEEFDCDSRRIIHVPDCVNTDVFSPRPRDAGWHAAKASLGIPSSRKVVVYLGLLAPYQGTGHLLQAGARLCRMRDDVHFVIAGFPNVDRYQRLAQQLGIEDRCAFPGRVPYEKAAEILSLGDVAVSPKLSLTEGAGKLLNYMAMGLPTVAFDTPVSREYLGDLGVYAVPRDADGLADKIAALLDSESGRADLGMKLRERVLRHYQWSRSGELILQAYAEMLRD